MHHFQHPFKKAILSASFVLPLLTCACGDDDSSDFEFETSSSSVEDDVLSSDDNEGSDYKVKTSKII